MILSTSDLLVVHVAKCVAIVLKHDPTKVEKILQADSPKQIAIALDLNPDLTIKESLPYLRLKYQE